MKKYVVYMTNQFCLLGKEYMKLDGQFAIGLHNPNLADHFTSEKAAKALQSKIKYDTKVCELQPELKKFVNTDWIYRKTPLINDDLNVMYDPKTMDKLHVLDWWKKMRLLPESAISQKVYASYPKPHSLFKHLWDTTSYHSRDYKKMYHTFSVRTSKNSSLTDFVEELDLVLEDVSHMSEDGYKILPIFDHTLSIGGTHYLYYKSKEDCKLIVSSYSPAPSWSLEKCFVEMCRSYYYE